MRRVNKSVLSGTICVALVLTGCGGAKMWPFGEDKNGPQYLANAVEYRCDGGKRFHVRFNDKTDAVWLIYSDREAALSRMPDDGGIRYSNGVAKLILNGKEASLDDGPSVAYRACQKVAP